MTCYCLRGFLMASSVDDLVGEVCPTLSCLPIMLYQEDNKIYNFHNITFPWTDCYNCWKNMMGILGHLLHQEWKRCAQEMVVCYTHIVEILEDTCD